MLKDITLGQYYPGNSVIHRTDPRIKILLTILFMTELFTVKTYLGFLIFTLFTLMIIVVSGVPIKFTLKGLKPVLIIVIFAVVINVFSTPGRSLLKLGPLNITLEGLLISGKMAIRLSLLIIGASLLTLTTTPIMLTDGLEKLLSPFKIIGLPAHEIAMMMTIALRFIPTLLDETDKIMKAQSARGADFDTGNLLDRAKSFIPVLVPLFVSAFRRADELAMAMEARCYRGSEGRTRMKQLKLGIIDIEVSMVMILFGLLILIVQ